MNSSTVRLRAWEMAAKATFQLIIMSTICIRRIVSVQPNAILRRMPISNPIYVSSSIIYGSAESSCFKVWTHLLFIYFFWRFFNSNTMMSHPSLCWKYEALKLSISAVNSNWFLALRTLNFKFVGYCRCWLLSACACIAYGNKEICAWQKTTTWTYRKHALNKKG